MCCCPKLGQKTKIQGALWNRDLKTILLLLLFSQLEKNRSKQFDYDALKAKMEKNKKVLKPKPTPTEKIAEVYSPQNNV